VLLVCLAGLAAVVQQLRCLDAAREAARLAARGDAAAAVRLAEAVAPAGARVQLHRDGDLHRARVSVAVPLLAGLTVTGEAAAAAEPGTG